MPASNTQFNERTTGDAVTSAFADRVKGKVILITGVSPGGIGASSAAALAKQSPKLLILAGRTESKLLETAKEVGNVNRNVVTKTLILDLGSQQSCRSAAKQVLDDAEIPQIDILINNAGVMNIENRTLSPEGIEMQFATNHVGHFLFTNLILPKIEIAAKNNAGAPGSTRIVNLSSRGITYGPVRFSDWNFTKKEADLPEEEHMSQDCRKQWNRTEDKPYIPEAAYGQSKTANALFSLGLNQRLAKKTAIFSVAVHPGLVGTNLARHMDQDLLKNAIDMITQRGMHMKNLEEGCSTSLVAALDPAVTEKDLIWGDCQVADWAPGYATDSAKADQLWKLSEELVGQKFDL